MKEIIFELRLWYASALLGWLFETMPKSKRTQDLSDAVVQCTIELIHV